MIGKLCDVPVQPLSRSLPVGGTVSVTWFGCPGVPFGQVPVVEPLTHCTRSLFTKPPGAFMTSVTGADGLNFLSGLLVFFGTRLSERLMVPARPQPGGETGGAWKPVRGFFLEVGALKVSERSVLGVQPAVA